jgi:hypothetical protein
MATDEKRRTLGLIQGAERIAKFCGPDFRARQVYYWRQKGGSVGNAIRKNGNVLIADPDRLREALLEEEAAESS